AVGVVLYQMLAGRKPFDGDEDIAIAHAILHDAPAAVTRDRHDVSAALEDLVLRLLEKDPARRCAAASELLTELAAVQNPEQGTMRSLRTRWRRARRTMSSRRAPIMTALGAVIGASGLFAWTVAQ